MKNHVLFLRLEGPLQAWGRQYAKWTFRDTALEPSKSGIIGMICCALGLRRNDEKLHKRLESLSAMKMGVRVDRPGSVIMDYHTVGAGNGVMAANGKIKLTALTKEIETVLSYRQYLADASFLVALMGDFEELSTIGNAFTKERNGENCGWTPYLGRKSCPPSVPVFSGTGEYDNLASALQSQPWRPRLAGIDRLPADRKVRFVLETEAQDEGASIRFDVPLAFFPPQHGPRYVREVEHEVVSGNPTQSEYRPTGHVRRKYDAEARKAWDRRKLQRADIDNHLCLFCKLPYEVTHHRTYERINNEDVDSDLRSLCDLCHGAITMIEEERGMLGERIDPMESKWQSKIVAKRAQISRERVNRHSSRRSR